MLTAIKNFNVNYVQIIEPWPKPGTSAQCLYISYEIML